MKPTKLQNNAVIVDSKFIYKPEEKEDLIKFITDILAMDYDRYKESFGQNRFEWGTKIMKFFQMPRTPLHAKFRSEIIAKRKIETENKATIRTENLIKSNLMEAHKDPRTRDNDSIDLNYFQIKVIDLVN